MLYFLNFNYSTRTASDIRLQGYYHALDKMGIKATIVYIHPDNHYSKMSTKYKNLSIEYLWSPFMLYRGPFRRLTLFQYIRKFLKRLKDGDIVYTYNISLLTKMCQSVQGVKVFAERTEHPDANPGFPNPLLSLTYDELVETIKKLSGLFVISSSLLEYYKEVGIDPSKIHIINMTVDADRFIGVNKKTDKEKYVAYCGTASNNKDGVDKLITAFAIVCKKHDKIKLLIIGKTPSEKEKTGNNALIKSLGIADKVIFTGFVNANLIPQLLMGAEVLLLDRPDNIQARNGFPTKLGEYLLTGKPVVVTKVGDIPLFLKDGESALLADPQNEQDFADKICWAIEHPKEASIIGAKGKEIALLNFNNIIETKKMIDYMYH